MGSWVDSLANLHEDEKRKPEIWKIPLPNRVFSTTKPNAREEFLGPPSANLHEDEKRMPEIWKIPSPNRVFSTTKPNTREELLGTPSEDDSCDLEGC